MLRRRIFIGDHFGVGPLYNTDDEEYVEQQRRIVRGAADASGAVTSRVNEIYEYGCSERNYGDCYSCKMRVPKICEAIGSMIAREGEDPERYGFSVIPEADEPYLHVFEGMEELIYTARGRQIEQNATIEPNE